MNDGLFDTILTLPNSTARERYGALVGLDEVKSRLEKESEALLRPDLLEKWSKEKHNHRLPAIDLLIRRPPLFIFAGDVGTGKTELAMTFGDNLARATKLRVELFCMGLRARGTGAVGEMTMLISNAFKHLHSATVKMVDHGKKPTGASILVIDEADSLAQSRELAQMHHEDRAGVNALIRGIDDIASAKLPCLTVMCTNRVAALDPAIQRRAAAIFEFKRPSFDLRKKLLMDALHGVNLSQEDIETIATALGETKDRPYGYTFSDITQRFIPALILAAYPAEKITLKLALDVAKQNQPTRPFADSV